LTQLRTSYPFLTEYNANHCVYQAISHAKLPPKEERTSLNKARFKVTPLARDIHVKKLLSEHPLHIYGIIQFLVHYPKEDIW
jgi:hypothetical protein